MTLLVQAVTEGAPGERLFGNFPAVIPWPQWPSVVNPDLLSTEPLIAKSAELW